MDGEFESRSCVFLPDPASRITNKINGQGLRVSVANEREANNVSQPISVFFFLYKCCEQPNRCIFREMWCFYKSELLKIFVDILFLK